MKFSYYAGEQLTPEWFKIRLGKVTASRLKDWMAVSKAKGKEGQPLKARTDYEKEIMFEREFDRNFERFITQAMQDGIDFEDFAAIQYEKIKKVKVERCGCWYNEFFVASPDRLVGKDGLLEIKWLKDTNFTEVLETGAPLDDHWKQMQGQMFASGRSWTDYVVGNLNTKKIKIIRVHADKEFHKKLEDSIQEKISVKPFEKKEVYDFVDQIPEEELAKAGSGAHEIGSELGF